MESPIIGLFEVNPDAAIQMLLQLPPKDIKNICSQNKSIAKVCNSEKFIKAYTCQYYKDEIIIWPRNGKHIIGNPNKQKYIIQCFLQLNTIENLKKYVLMDSITLNLDVFEWLLTNKIFTEVEVIQNFNVEGARHFKDLQHLLGYDHNSCEFFLLYTYTKGSPTFIPTAHLSSNDKKIVKMIIKIYDKGIEYEMDRAKHTKKMRERSSKKGHFKGTKYDSDSD